MEAKQECLRQIAQMRRTHGTESDWSTLHGEAARSLGARPVALPLPNPSDPALYLDFFGQILDFAVFPQKSKHALALGSDINSKSKASEWTCEQMTADALHPQWIHRSLIDQLGILFAYLSHRIGDCRLPIYIGPKVASQLIAFRNSASRRMVGPSPRMIRR